MIAEGEVVLLCSVGACTSHRFIKRDETMPAGTFVIVSACPAHELEHEQGGELYLNRKGEELAPDA